MQFPELSTATSPGKTRDRLSAKGKIHLEKAPASAILKSLGVTRREQAVAKHAYRAAVMGGGKGVDQKPAAKRKKSLKSASIAKG